MVQEVDSGESRVEALLPAVYDQLRELARRRLGGAERGGTLQPTALVHEVYLKLAENSRVHWNDREHVLAAAAQAIRWILVDRARRRMAERHGGGAQRVSLGQVDGERFDDDGGMLDLDRALRRLQDTRPRLYEVVMLRYFVGLSIEDTAETLGVSPATVKRDWNFARAWLLVELQADATRGDAS